MCNMAVSGASLEETNAGLMPELREGQPLQVDEAAWTASDNPGQPVPPHQRASLSCPKSSSALHRNPQACHLRHAHHCRCGAHDQKKSLLVSEECCIAGWVKEASRHKQRCKEAGSLWAGLAPTGSTRSQQW